MAEPDADLEHLRQKFVELEVELVAAQTRNQHLESEIDKMRSKADKGGAAGGGIEAGSPLKRAISRQHSTRNSVGQQEGQLSAVPSEVVVQLQEQVRARGVGIVQSCDPCPLGSA